MRLKNAEAAMYYVGAANAKKASGGVPGVAIAPPRKVKKEMLPGEGDKGDKKHDYLKKSKTYARLNRDL